MCHGGARLFVFGLKPRFVLTFILYGSESWAFYGKNAVCGCLKRVLEVYLGNAVARCR
jgi:hypothetical protein